MNKKNQMRIQLIERKILDITNLATKANLSEKSTKTGNKIPYTRKFIHTNEFSRLRNKCWCKNSANMKKSCKSQVGTALDLG